jgi:dipeptidyl aminopeptidase/acylaminoacyl peptidase
MLWKLISNLKEICKVKKYLTLLLVLIFTASVLFIGISCKEEVLLTEEVVKEEGEISEEVEEEDESEKIVEEEVRLTNNSEDDGRPFWSPDGQMIAFESYRDGNWEVYVMNADGSGEINLTKNSAYDYEPSWSPDGKKIVFISDRDGNFEIYVMNADGKK